MKFVIERSSENLFSHAGLTLVGSLIKKSGLAPLLDKIDPRHSAIDVYPSSDIAKSMIGLLCMAKPDPGSSPGQASMISFPSAKTGCLSKLWI